MFTEKLNRTALTAMVLAAGIVQTASAAPIPVAYWRFDFFNMSLPRAQPTLHIFEAGV